MRASVPRLGKAVLDWGVLWIGRGDRDDGETGMRHWDGGKLGTVQIFNQCGLVEQRGAIRPVEGGLSPTHSDNPCRQIVVAKVDSRQSCKY